MTKMNPEVKALWLEALRSGEYEQGVGHLNQDGKLCCLGVLCEVAIRAALDVTKGHSEFDPTVVTYSGSSDRLPWSLQKWSGVDGVGNIGDAYRAGLPEGSLAGLNDEAKYTFDEIAEVIEEHF